MQPYPLFSSLAFTYVGAMVASNSALSFISYPTQVLMIQFSYTSVPTCFTLIKQVLGKSAKPIPVMILGVLIGGKRYPRIKFFIVLLIVVGVALFFYKEDDTVDNYDNQTKLFHIIGFGELLLVSL